MFRIGHSLHRNFTEELFAKMKSVGLATAEINGTGHDFKQMKLFADRQGIELYSRHLPYDPEQGLDISLTDAETRKKALSYHSELIKEGADVGIGKFIVHPSTPIPEGDDRNERKKCAMEMFDKLAEVAYREGAIIAAEDMIATCLGNSAEELLEMISVNDKLRICFDVNHLFNNTHEEFIKIAGSKIVHTHISDYDFIEERHWFPGEGKIDWVTLYRALRDSGYNGVWNYEANLGGGKAKERGRPLTYEELAENARTIFSEKQPLPYV